jgi:solute carrier family 45 protein 1/2/4
MVSTILVSILGISWALTQWAPFALLSTAIAAQKSSTIVNAEAKHLISTCLDRHSATFPDDDSSSNEDEMDEKDGAMINTGELDIGTVMGIYNAAVAVPQLLAALISSGIFWLLIRWGWEENEAVGWVIRMGGLAGILAAWVIFELEKNCNL